MQRLICAVLSAWIWTALPLAAANDGLFVGAGYAAPAPVEVAPGQIVTLFFRGIPAAADGSLRVARAQSLPVPEMLAGLAVEIDQLPRTTPYRLPVLAVMQVNECEVVTFRPICLLTAIRIQIPMELTPAVAKLFVVVDGERGRNTLLRPVRENSHVLSACDITWDTNPGSTCNRLAFHADGKAVSEVWPARRGETLVVYAYGLGPVEPRVATGEVSPAGAVVGEPVSRVLRVTFRVFRNANGSLPRYFDTEAPPADAAPEFAGLTPGQIGLYQMNVKVPESLEIPIACGGDTKSNVLAKVFTSQGVENLAFCVEP